jgi:hypothetical protein
MNYSKPQIVLLGSAAQAIQGNCKGVQANPDHHITSDDATVGAYEADE